jgi:2-iminobutanoate/2-iminopropanoate deaminase
VCENERSGHRLLETVSVVTFFRMANAKLSTPSAPAPRGFYSQAVRNGNLLFISGQLPLDTSGNLVGATIAEHAIQTMKNIQAILEAAGGTLENLAQVTVYITDLAHWPEFNAIYERFLGQIAVPPARAVVPVNALNKGSLVEIQAIACLD